MKWVFSDLGLERERERGGVLGETTQRREFKRGGRNERERERERGGGEKEERIKVRDKVVF